MTLSCFHHLPKGSIVQIIYMAIDLPPSEVIFQTLVIRIAHNPPIKTRNFHHFSLHKALPIGHICSGKGRNHACQDFISPARKKRGIFVEDKRVLIRLSICQEDFSECSADMLSCCVHQLNGTKIIGLCEIMSSTKLGEPSTLNHSLAYINSNKDVGLGQRAFLLLKLLNIFIFGASHLLYFVLIYYNFEFLQLMEQATNDVVFIRHAESEFNKEVVEYVARKQIAYDWDHLSKDHEFLAQHKYSQHLVDASITAKGRQQCEQARKALNGFEPDVILVSPLNRTLLTCSLIFPEPKCPVIVEPVLSEAIRSSCDISGELQPKKALYPHYNFERVQAQGEFWFLNNESQENQKVYRKIMLENPNLSFREMLRKFMEVMLETWIYQTAKNLRRRTDKVKDLLREYRKKYSSIAVVSHYNIIRFTIAKEFNNHDEPYHCLIKNCEVIPKSTEQL